MTAALLPRLRRLTHRPGGSPDGEARTALPAASRAGPAPGGGPASAGLLGRTGYASLALGVLILLAIGAVSVVLATRNDDALAQAAHTQDIRSAVDDVLQYLADAETGQRGYLLTGKSSYLDPYRQAVAALGPMLDRLQALTADDPENQATVLRIRRLAGAKMAELAQTVALTQSGQSDKALVLVQSDQGQRAMQELRRLTRQVAGAQQARLGTTLAGIAAGGRLLVATDVTGLLVIMLVAAGLAVATRRGLRTLRAAQDELSAANVKLGLANESLEEKVALRTSELTAANDEIQRFAYIVSHDLRAPLVNIMGFTSELETATKTLARFIDDVVIDQPPADTPAVAPGEGAPAAPVPLPFPVPGAPMRAEITSAGRAEVARVAREDLPEAIRFIKASTGKMDRLIGAILRLSREGRRELAPERVEMSRLMTGIVESVAHQISERGATISLGDMPDLVTDRIAVEQIFSNLIENAFKYLKPGRPGAIAVRGRALGRSAIFEVSDNGRGIAARDLERVFELFRRAGDQTVPGEGIGLAHVRALVRRLGGRIDCESTLDVGSTFRVQLPLVLTQSAEMRP